MPGFTGTERASVNQVAQIGLESTPGTGVAATKLIEQTDFSVTPKYQSKSFRAQGRKHTLVVVPAKEWTEAKLSGPLSYTESIYWFSGCIAAVTPSTHPSGSTSKDWVFTPPLTGNATIQPYTVEKGDAIRAMKFTYGLMTGFGIKATRDSVEFSGDMMGQAITDGITLTGSLTGVGVQPVLPLHINWYMDSTAGGIGGTQLNDVLEGDFQSTGYFGPYWPMKRTSTSFTKHIDMAPKTTFKMKMEADAVGMSPLVNARVGSTLYFQMDAQGAIIESAIPYEMKLNFAAKIASIGAFSDDAGVYAIEWNFEVVEDTGLTYPFQITVTNAISAL